MDIIVPAALILLGLAGGWFWLGRSEAGQRGAALTEHERAWLSDELGAALAALVDEGAWLCSRIDAMQAEVRAHLSFISDYGDFSRSDPRRIREQAMTMQLYRLLEDVQRWLLRGDAQGVPDTLMRHSSRIRELVPPPPGSQLLATPDDARDILVHLDILSVILHHFVLDALDYDRMPRSLGIDDEGELLALTLTPVRIDATRAETLEISALALLAGNTVGFDLTLQPAGSRMNQQEFIGVGVLRSRGAQSDELLRWLARRFGCDDATLTMREDLEVEVHALRGDPMDHTSEAVVLEFFAASEHEDVAEWLISLEPGAGRLVLAEKDVCHRDAIIAAWRAPDMAGT
jgi:hypothetical protein